MALLTPALFLQRYDERPVLQRTKDDGTNASSSDLLSSATTAGGNLKACIDDAEALLVAAASVGSRYALADFVTLKSDYDADPTGNHPSAKLMFRVLSDLTWGLVLKRRSMPAEEFAKLAPSYAEACAFLDQIRYGERVFADVPGVAAAGLPDTVTNVPVVGVDLGPPLFSSNNRMFGSLDIFPGS